MMKANRKEIPVWTLSDLGLDAEKVGLRGSPTQVCKIFTPKQRLQGEIIQADTAREAVAILVKKLSNAKIVAL